MPKSQTLEPWNGATPRVVETLKEHPGFTVGRVPGVSKAGKKEPIPVGDSWLGLWGPTGLLVVGVPGTQLLELIPGRDEVALLRQEGVRTPRWRCDTWFERWSLGGQRRSQLLLNARLPTNNLAMMTFAKKHRGSVAKVLSADEDGRSAFFVAIGEPDRAAATVAELEGGVVVVPPEKRAANLHTPSEELAVLANQSVSLAVAVASNWAAPPPLLAKLAAHADAKVRAAVATNGGLPVAAQTKLACDPEVNVRLALFTMRNVFDPETQELRRTGIDARVHAMLAKDPEPRVRAAAVKEGGSGSVNLATESLEVRRAAVQWGISIERERELARDPSAKVRLKLAVTRHPRRCGRSPSIDGEALESLRNDTSKAVREAAAALSPYPKGTTQAPR